MQHLCCYACAEAIATVALACVVVLAAVAPTFLWLPQLQHYFYDSNAITMRASRLSVGSQLSCCRGHRRCHRAALCCTFRNLNQRGGHKQSTSTTKNPCIRSFGRNHASPSEYSAAEATRYCTAKTVAEKFNSWTCSQSVSRSALCACRKITW